LATGINSYADQQHYTTDNPYSLFIHMSPFFGIVRRPNVVTFASSTKYKNSDR